MPEDSERGHEIVQIDISFTCRQFDRPIAFDSSATIATRHARLQPRIRPATRESRLLARRSIARNGPATTEVSILMSNTGGRTGRGRG